METFKIMGIKITSATMDELHQAIGLIVDQGGPGFVLYANVHGINLAQGQPWLRDFFLGADLVHVDGSGVVLGARLLGYRILPRITWADWGWKLAELFAREDYGLFLLGDEKGVADIAAQKLTLHAPGLRVVGTHHGFFDCFGPENQKVIDQINRAKPDILWVGMGMPLQERWILDNFQALDVKVHMVCGAAFRYLGGLTTRCPPWFANHGLEWLYRFLQEPRRMAGRYLIGNPKFLLGVLKERVRM